MIFKNNISVAMATYNGERYIKDQLESIAAQTHPPFELVVCDDGSKDRTLKVVRAFAARSPFPVKIIENEENLGYARNFIKCISNCTGDWIALCDQDDVWNVRKLEIIDLEIQKNPSATLVIHSADLVDGELKRIPGRIPNIRRDYVRKPPSLPVWYVGCSMTIRSGLIGNFEYPEVHSHWDSSAAIGHDAWAAYLAGALGDVVEISQSLCLYRRHSETVTGNLNVPTVKKRLSRSLGQRANQFSHLSSHLLEIGQALEKQAERAPTPAMKTQLLTASKLSLLRQAAAERRYMMFLKPYPGGFKILGRLILTGGYTERNWGFGLAAFMKDAAILLLTFWSRRREPAKACY